MKKQLIAYGALLGVTLVSYVIAEDSYRKLNKKLNSKQAKKVVQLEVKVIEDILNELNREIKFNQEINKVHKTAIEQAKKNNKELILEREKAIFEMAKKRGFISSDAEFIGFNS